MRACTSDSIEVFEILIEAKQLVWLLSVQHNTMRELNDVVATSKSTFYATNWLHYPVGTLDNAVEVLTQRPWGSIVYCRFEPREIDCHTAAEHLTMPNGIELSPDKSEVFVSGGGENALLVFRRPPSEDAEERRHVQLQPLCRVPLGASPDNLHIDQAVADDDAHFGSVLVTSHARTLTFLRHAHDHAVASPSLVQRVTWHRRHSDVFRRSAFTASGVDDRNASAAVDAQLECAANVTTVFSSPGETRTPTDIPAASIALRVGRKQRRLLLGSVFAFGYLSCAPTDGV